MSALFKIATNSLFFALSCKLPSVNVEAAWSRRNGGNLKSTQLLATFAREAVREYLHACGTPESSPEGAFSGFRVSSERVAQSLVAKHPNLFNDNVETAKQTREKALRGWLAGTVPEMAHLAEFAKLFHLDLKDVEIFILAAAPALDPSIQELYAFVWNDVRKKCADIGFIATLLSLGQPKSYEEYLERLSWSGPLRLHRLIQVESRRNNEDPLDRNLPGRRVRASDRVLDFLRYGSGDRVPVDEALASVCKRSDGSLASESLALPHSSREALHQVARSESIRALLVGPPGAGKRSACHTLSMDAGKTLLIVDLSALLNEPPRELEEQLWAILREARLGGSWVYLRSHDLPEQLSGPSTLVVERFLSEEGLLLGTDKLPGWLVPATAGWPEIEIPLPDAHYRTAFWNEEFKSPELAFPAEQLSGIANRYQMSRHQIRQAATESRRIGRIHGRSRIELNDVNRACRSYFAHQLSDLADPVPPASFRPEDLILEGPERKKFDEILLVAKEQEAVYDEWGFGEKFPYGRGLSVLFYGPPGTGKTMASTIIANILGLDLYRIDLSRIVSRYVGETEKNLARVFDEAERGRVMLLFDEADSLFTKRTEVKNSVDRYANLEVAYLLQRMESFEGLTVLTTNVVENLDDAFTRRIRYRIGFPMPSADTRTMLWQTFLPDKAPRRDGIPFELLGEEFALAGAYIKKAVLRAAFYARSDNDVIGLRHLVEAARSESEELGSLVYDHISGPLDEALEMEQERKAVKG